MHLNAAVGRDPQVAWPRRPITKEIATVDRIEHASELIYKLVAAVEEKVPAW